MKNKIKKTKCSVNFFFSSSRWFKEINDERCLYVCCRESGKRNRSISQRVRISCGVSVEGNRRNSKCPRGEQWLYYQESQLRQRKYYVVTFLFLSVFFSPLLSDDTLNMRQKNKNIFDTEKMNILLKIEAKEKEDAGTNPQTILL